MLTIKEPPSLKRCLWFFFFVTLLLLTTLLGCTKEEGLYHPSLILKTGNAYTKSGAIIPIGGTIKIGVLASGAGAPLTHIRIDRITHYDTLTQLDRGIYVNSEGLDVDYTFSKDTASIEHWRILVMNADRDTAIKILTIYKGSGSAYGPIHNYKNITLSYQSNHSFGHYLDTHTGKTFDEVTVSGHEQEIDVLAYYYITSGLSSPTFTCPGYTASVGFYAQMTVWPIKNNTLYDYRTSDNNLVTPNQFDVATNDSLLVTAYKPDKVSGNCKYGYTGKIIPFKTQDGRYGMVKVLQADESEAGTIKIDIKIQK